MAITFGNIHGAEPSTVTFTAATVTISRGSTAEQQEIICLGDPQTSNAISRVLANAPASTEFGLAVRIVSGPSSAADLPVQISGNSTVVQGTTPWVVGGNSSVRANLSSTAADNPVSISGNSTVIQGTSPWVIGGNSSVRANLSSTAADNPVQISGNSTVVIASGNSSVIVTSGTLTAVSSVGGVVTVTPSSTGWVKSAGFSVDSSNFLNVNASFTGSTNVTISAGNSSVTVAAFAAGATPIFDSSNAAVKPGDSANNAIRVNIVADAAGSAVATENNAVVGGVANVAQVIGQTYGFDGSTNWIRVQASTSGASTGAAGLVVRQAFPRPATASSTSAFAASTSFTVASSNASKRSKVYAYSITTTNATATQLAFYDGGTMKWPIVFQAISSAVFGANLAVSPPAYLFENSTGAALTLQMNGSSQAGWIVGVSYFQGT